MTRSVRRRRRTARSGEEGAVEEGGGCRAAAPAAPQFTLHGATAADAAAAAAASAAALHPLLATNAVDGGSSSAVFAQLHREQAVAAQLQMQQINNYQMIQNLMGMYSQNQLAVPGMAPGGAPSAPGGAVGACAKRRVRGESAVILQQSLRHHRGRDARRAPDSRSPAIPTTEEAWIQETREFTTLYVKNQAEAERRLQMEPALLRNENIRNFIAAHRAHNQQPDPPPTGKFSG